MVWKSRVRIHFMCCCVFRCFLVTVADWANWTSDPISFDKEILFLTHATCLKLSFYFVSTFDWPLALLSLLFCEESSLSSAREQTQTEIHLLWQPLPVICSAAAADFRSFRRKMRRRRSFLRGSRSTTPSEWPKRWRLRWVRLGPMPITAYKRPCLGF